MRTKSKLGSSCELWPGRQSHEVKARCWIHRQPWAMEKNQSLPQMQGQLAAEPVLEPKWPQTPRSGGLSPPQGCLVLHNHRPVTPGMCCSVTRGIRTGKRYQKGVFLWDNGRATHGAECGFLKEWEEMKVSLGYFNHCSSAIKNLPKPVHL